MENCIKFQIVETCKEQIAILIERGFHTTLQILDNEYPAGMKIYYKKIILIFNLYPETPW